MESVRLEVSKSEIPSNTMDVVHAEAIEGVHVFRLGDFKLRVCTDRSMGSPLEVSLRGDMVFKSPARSDWVRLYTKGYALPESRGFFFPKPLDKRGTDGGWPTHAEQVAHVVTLRGEASGTSWDVRIYLGEHDDLVLALRSEFARVELASHRRYKARRRWRHI